MKKADNQEIAERRRFKFPINFKDIGIVYALVLLIVLLALTNGSFQRVNTYISIMRDSALVGIAGIGMTFCIAAGMFDLSVGTMMALIAIVNIQSATNYGILCLPITLMMGAVCGSINGILVAKVKIPAFIATLAMYFTYSAVALIISGSRQVGFTADWFKAISSGNILGIPNPFIYMVILGILGTIILRKTPLGRRIIAVGNSEKAAYNCGINCDNTKIIIFILVGIFTALAAFVISSYLTMADADIVPGYEFDVITAVVLGGTALSGGKGSIFNTIIAAIFLSTLTLGMNRFQIDSFTQKIVEGLVLLFAFSMTNTRELITAALRKLKKKKSLSVNNG